MFLQIASNGKAINLIYNNQCTDSLSFPYHAYFRERGCLFANEANRFYEFKANAQHKIQQSTYLASTTIQNVNYTNQYIILIDNAGMVFIYDRISKNLIDKLQAPLGANCAFVDSYHQLWVGTKNEGLFCTQKQPHATHPQRKPSVGVASRRAEL